jgi:hypothetical protein
MSVVDTVALQAAVAERWSMMRSDADLDTPSSGASCRMVRFVRQ